MRPMLLANPAFINHPAFATLVGDHIGGGNKFTLLDALGNMVTVNEDQGVRFNGAWLSNTYAWNSKSQKYVSCRPPTPTYMGYGTGYGASYGVSARDKRYSSDSWDDDEYAEKYTLVSPIGLLNKQAQSAKNGLDDDGWSSEEDFVGALFEYIDASYVMGDADRFGYGMVRTYYETVGDDAAWDLIDTLENFAIDADTLVDILDRKLLHIDLVTV
ncbi:hypothetical protein [Methylotenera sp.]|uniref:hypothetical protein n=1 Tax=Methylotenera sp. TaxID=2051956 RepID=UPI002736E7B4|nr:hypothetical protein [Methylotenera sp.]MDP3308279.1 hypothetical protein [Methylotenera sp.]